MSDLLERGLLLFNSAQYYEAHEVWEDLWRASVESQKTCCQGLIQAAVGLHHLSRGNVAGGHSQLRKSIRNLGACSLAWCALDTEDLIRQLDGVLRGPRETAAPPVRITRLK